MNFFINKYPIEGNTILYDLIEDVSQNEVLTIGFRGDQGFITRLDQSGNPVWMKSYRIDGEQIAFYRYAETSNDDYLLLGRFIVNTPRRAHHLLMRVNKDGIPIWVKRIHTDKTRNNIGITRRGNEHYITCWYNSVGTNDKTEVHRIDAKGNVVQSALFSIGTDDQINSIVNTGSYLTLVGGTNRGTPWDASISFIHPNLTVDATKTFLLNHPNENSREDIYGLAYLDQGTIGIEMTKFYLVGKTRIGNTSHSLITEVHYSGIDLVLHRSFKFDVTGGKDHIRKIIIHGGFMYILGQRIGGPYSFVVKLNMDYHLVWAKKFDIEENYGLIDFRVKNDTELWFSGYMGNEGNYEALVIKTDLDLATCKTIDIPNISLEEFPMEIQERTTTLETISAEQSGYDIEVIDIPNEKISLCPQPTLEITDDNWVQSPYLYLQSAGSLGQDATEGILLRWFLLRNLGQEHLPKGDYAATTNGFNKPDDYVKIYRAKYDIKEQRVLHFKDHIPQYISDTERKWVYDIDGQIYYLFFRDEQKYDTLLNTYNTSQQYFPFIIDYGDGLYELEIRNRLAFSVEFNLYTTNSLTYQLQTETFSVQGNMPLEEEAVSSRKEFDQNGPTPRIVEENIRRVKFRLTHASPISIHFEMYIDFLDKKIDTFGWEELGQFALSENQTEVFKRLEDTSKVHIDGHWQKYNHDAYVNTQNYKDRWGDPPYNHPDFLGHGVKKYIDLSNIDPSATETITEEIDGDASMDVSYFDLLNVVSLDYHIARMLGLGHIDTPGGPDSEQYIYLAEYKTLGQLDFFSEPSSRQHLYLTIPTSMQEERFPQKIKTLPVEYGLNVYNGTNQGLQLTDNNGYVPYAPIRYIGIKTDLLQNDSIYHSFFNPSQPFSLSSYSSPALAGVEYKKQGESSWRKPEISHDPNFKDANPQEDFETIPLPYQDDPSNPLFIHKETEEGIHGYAAYSINIFSRASQIHNTVFTNYTEFIKPNTLLPPHNLHVQLIQEEFPLMLTSNNEQAMLNALSGDTTLVRLTFLYTHLHDINYDFGNRIEIFFREELPRNIVGGIANIIDDTNNQYSIVTTQNYTYNSNGQTITPNIPSSLINNFKGGVLVVNEKRYHIEDIILTNTNGDYPKLKVKKEEDRNTVDLGGGNIITTQDYIAPDAANGDLFMIIENMAIEQSWGAPNPLSFQINIDDSNWTTATDSYIDDNDETITNDVRGIWDTAIITRRTSGPEGVYDVKLDNISLNNHNQHNNAPGANSVNWYKGIIRVRINDDISGEKERKVLDVVQITNTGTGQNLELVIHDETYDTISTGGNIKEGTNIEVNFYPGYRAYLRRNNPDGFNAASILPAFGEGSKKTLIGLRTIDTNTQDSGGIDYHSNIGIPQILFAQEIITPQKPQLPTGPAYATPPDFYGRSTYTFTTEFNQVPYAAMFYRADVNAVLKALYKQETIDLIKSELPSPYEDEFYSDRLKDIVGFDYPVPDPNTNIEGTFSEFPLDNGNYHYPNPDNDDNGFDGLSVPADIVGKIQDAIWEVFLPLTEHPLIYSFIKGGDYIPIPKKQTIRDKYGKLLKPSDPEYDLTPMAKKVNGPGNQIRFTDFTLDGEMSKETTYFYFVREMGNRMSVSEPSDILGPIQLINTNAPEPPIIRKVTTQLANPVSGANTAVKFEINEYPSSQNIKKIQIYRTTEAVNAMTPRTMDLVKEFDSASVDINNGIITIYDDFQHNNFLPFGEPLYYKIVACREIKYVDIDENDVIDYVPSKPTKTLLSNIVDNVNPEPPHIDETIGSTANDELSGLVLNWNKTAHNGKYFLFKMNSVGNWNKLYEVKSNDEADLEFSFSDPLAKLDEDGNKIYHRFKVTVENSSGLLNLSEDILTL